MAAKNHQFHSAADTEQKCLCSRKLSTIDILKITESILMPVDTSGRPGRAMKGSTLGIRRSKFKVTRPKDGFGGLEDALSTPFVEWLSGLKYFIYSRCIQMLLLFLLLLILIYLAETVSVCRL